MCFMSLQSFLSCSFISHVFLQRNRFITKKFKVQIISSAQVKVIAQNLTQASLTDGDETYEGGI